jgi:hypothetical protein
MTTKWCTVCKEHKLLEEFHSSPSKRDGKQSYCKQCRNSYNYVLKYGITEEEYRELYIQQNGLCSICGGIPTGKYAKLYVDHDHISGEIRGLLCQGCNSGIGYLKDSEEIVLKAYSYLSKFGKNKLRVVK